MIENNPKAQNPQYNVFVENEEVNIQANTWQYLKSLGPPVK